MCIYNFGVCECIYVNINKSVCESAEPGDIIIRYILQMGKNFNLALCKTNVSTFSTMFLEILLAAAFSGVCLSLSLSLLPLDEC